MNAYLILKSKVSTEKPYTQLPDEWYGLDHDKASGLLHLNRNRIRGSYLERMMQEKGYKFKTGRIIVDASLFRWLREKIGVKIGTDDVPLTLALLELPPKDRTVNHMS